MLSVTLLSTRAGRAPDAYHAGLHFPAATVAKRDNFALCCRPQSSKEPIMFTDIINGLFADYDEGFHSTQAVTPERIAQVEAALGYPLPASYIALMTLHNGGSLNRYIYRYPEEDGSESELLVHDISGIGFDGDSTLCGACGSRFWEDPDNWGYPPIGIYFAEEDSGHGLFALDYRNLPADDEPPVVNIYHDGMTITRIAAHFAEFVRRLSGDDDN